MDIFEKITGDDLEIMGYKWAEHLIGDDWPSEIKGTLKETFVNGFMAGAIQIRAIVEEFGNEKEAN